MADPVAFQLDSFQLDSFQTSTLLVVAPLATLTLAAATPLAVNKNIFYIPAPSYGPAFQPNAFQNNAFQVRQGGSIVLSAPTPSIAFRFAVPAGHLFLTALPIVIRGAITVPAGALTLTGYAPNFARKVRILVPAPGAGAFQLGAFQIEAFQVRGSGGLLLSSLVVAARRIAIFPPTASLILTPYAPLLAKRIIVPAGTLSLTAIAPAFVGNRVIHVPSGQIAQQQIPGWLFIDDAGATDQTFVPGGPYVDASAVDFALRGIAPTVVVSLPRGQLALTAQTPIFRQRRAYFPQLGQLMLTPVAPTVVVGSAPSQIIDVPSGALSLAGIAPILIRDRIVQVPYATLQLQAGTLLVTVHFGPPVTDDYFHAWILMDG